MNCEICLLRELAREPDPVETGSITAGLGQPHRSHVVQLNLPEQIQHIEAHLFDALDRLAVLEAKLFGNAQPNATRSAARSA